MNCQSNLSENAKCGHLSLDGSRGSSGRLLDLKLADKLLKVEEGERIIARDGRVILEQITELGVREDVLALGRVIKVVSLDILTN